MWKAADPRHHFNQSWGGYGWRYARSRLVRRIACKKAGKQPGSTENVLKSTYAEKPSPLLKVHYYQSPTKTQGLLIQFIVERFTSSSWQTGVRKAENSYDSQYNYSIGKTGDRKQQIVWVLSSWPPHIIKRGRRSGATSQMDTYCIPLCKLLI